MSTKYKNTGGVIALFLLIVALVAVIILLGGCAGRHAYSSTDSKADPNREQYAGTRFFDGHYHDLWCKQDQRTGDKVCRFE